LTVVNEYVGNVIIPTQIIMYNKCCSKQTSQSECSIHIKFKYTDHVFFRNYDQH